jgi:hypothetical protein
MACQGTVRHCAVRFGKAGLGRPGMVWFGRVRIGKVRQVRQVRRVVVGYGKVWFSKAGEARQRSVG